jgi:hypothetical protein
MKPTNITATVIQTARFTKRTHGRLRLTGRFEMGLGPLISFHYGIQTSTIVCNKDALRKVAAPADLGVSQKFHRQQ